MLLAALPPMGLLVASTQQLRRAAMEETSESTLSLALLSAHSLNEPIGQARQLLATLAQLEAVRGSDPQACSALLASLLPNFPAYSFIGVARPDGSLRCGAIPAQPGFTVADRDWFRRALGEREFTVGAYVIGRVTGRPVLPLAYPLLAGDQVEGVLFLGLDIWQLGAAFGRIELASGAEAVVVDAQGVLLGRYPNPGGWIGQPVKEVPAVRSILSRQAPGTVREAGLDGAERLYGFAPLASGAQRWGYVAIGIPLETAYGPANRVFRANVVAMGAVAAFALLATWVFGEFGLVRPARSLLAAARRVAAGDLGARSAFAVRVGELGELGRAFDEMGARLEEREAGRRQAEAVVAEQKAYLSTLLDALGDGVFTVRMPQRRIEYVNRAVTEIFGYQPQELIGQTTRVLYASQEKFVEYGQRILEALEQGRNEVLAELPLRRKDGRPVWAEVHTRLLQRTGDHWAVITVVRDVTERKRAEEVRNRLGAILEATPDLVATADLETRIVYINRGGRKLLGYGEQEEISGLRIAQAHPEWARSRILNEALPAAAREGTWHGETAMLTHDGREVPVSQVVIAHKAPDGSVQYYSTIARDLSERKQAESRIQEQLEMLAGLYRGAQRLSENLNVQAVATEVVRICADVFQTRLASLERTEPDGRVTVLAQYPQDLTPGEVVAPTGAQASAAFPLLRRGHTLGLLKLYSDRPGFFTKERVEVFQAFAHHAAAALENARLFEEAQRRLSHIQALRNIDLAITGSLDLRVTFTVALDEIVNQLGISAACILQLNPHIRTLEYAVGRGFRTASIEKRRMKVGEGPAGEAALHRRMVHIPDLEAAGTERVLLPTLAEEGFKVYYAVPLIAKGRVLGVLELFHRAPLEGDEAWVEFLHTLAGQTAIAMDNAGLFYDLERANSALLDAYDATIEGWARALDLRDQETEHHTQRVTELTLRLARAMGMRDEELVQVRRGALLHDIGKMGVPDTILLKPGPLTEEERRIIQRHPRLAYELLAPIDYLRPALDIPYCHHEKWDGTGYPRGLKGEQIPLAARIFAVADVYDALTSDRPYRKAWPREKALEYIREQSGRHFDPKVVEAFLKMIDEPGG